MQMTRKGAIRLVGGLMAALIGLAGPGMANEEIEKRAKDPNTWPAPGRDNKLTRHSPLKDINTDNVGKLQMVWSQSTGALRGHEGQPLVIDDVGGKPMMFFISGCPNMAQCNIVQGLDLTDPDNPKQIWNYVKKDDRDESAVPRACCDTVNRGAVLRRRQGRSIGTLDGFVIALDASTGKEAWVVKHAYPEKGETITVRSADRREPRHHRLRRRRVRCPRSRDGVRPRDGKKVWECHSTGSDKDVCLTTDTNKANPHYGMAGTDLGIKTFPRTSDWKIGGGAAWGWYSYDPELKLVYYSTGNPGLWSPSYRCPTRPTTSATRASSTTSGR